MATQYIFDGVSRIIPGVYSTVKSGISNPAVATAFGNTLIIDTGNGAGFGGGSGVNGEYQSGKDSRYTFDDLSDVQSFLGGGFYWFLSRPMFRPLQGSNGVSSLTYIRAATTVAAQSELFVDETRATVAITAAGTFATNDTVEIKDPTDTTVIASITVTGATPTPTDVATQIADDITARSNSTGYTAVAAVDTVTITNTGGRGAQDNAQNLVINLVSTSGTLPTAPFTGGVDGGYLLIKTKDEGRAGNGVEADETRATTELEVTTTFATGDVLTISHDGNTILAYTFTSTPATTEASTSEIIAAINANTFQSGYSAIAGTTSTSHLIIQNVPGRGAKDNTEAVTAVVGGTGTGVITSGIFTGGADGTLLSQGYALVIKQGTLDISKYIIELYRGSFKGYDTVLTGNVNTTYEGLLPTEAGNELIYQSSEVSDIEEFVTEAESSAAFQSRFRVPTYSNRAFVPGDLTTFAGNNLFVGGTENFSTSDLNDALDALEGDFYDFVFMPDWGENANSVTNNTIQLGLTDSNSKILPDFYVAGGKLSGNFTATGGSIPAAASWNSQTVTVVHSGVQDTDPKTPSLLRDYDSPLNAAYVLGREAGIAPEIPLTFKATGIKGLLHNPTEKEKEQALNGGVLAYFLDSDNAFYCLKGVNTLQGTRNRFLVNPDGTSHSKQIRRISRQLNKELIINITDNILKDPTGVNRSTLRTSDLEQYVVAYLKNQEGGLITSFQNVTVTVDGDAYFFNYEFSPSFEVSFVFGTGFIIDNQSSN